MKGEIFKYLNQDDEYMYFKVLKEFDSGYGDLSYKTLGVVRFEKGKQE